MKVLILSEIIVLKDVPDSCLDDLNALCIPYRYVCGGVEIRVKDTSFKRLYKLMYDFTLNDIKIELV